MAKKTKVVEKAEKTTKKKVKVEKNKNEYVQPINDNNQVRLALYEPPEGRGSKTFAFRKFWIKDGEWAAGKGMNLSLEQTATYIVAIYYWAKKNALLKDLMAAAEKKHKKSLDE